MAFNTFAGQTAPSLVQLDQNFAKCPELDASGNMTLSGKAAFGGSLSAWGAAVSAVQIGTYSVVYNRGTVVGLGNNFFHDGTNYIYASAGAAGEYRYDRSTGNHEWYVAASGSGGATITWTKVAQITGTGQRSTVVPSGTTLLPSYDCRAWVSWNGTGTVAIRASGNVTSVTDLGVGYYRVNFTTAMPDVNYACVFGGGNANASVFGYYQTMNQLVGSVDVQYFVPNALADVPWLSVAIFR